MANDKVTIKDVYELVDRKIDKLEKKVVTRFETVEEDVDENTTFRNQLIGKIAVLVFVLGFGINWVWDFIVNNK